MKQTSIAARVWLILGLFATGMLANSFLEVTSTRNAIQSCYAGNVEHVVDIAKSILRHYHRRQMAGELTEAEAQALALEAISAIRYDGGNYIFMGDENGIAISNGIKELVGTNILGMQDPTGLPLVRNLYQVAASGGGFVDYQWPDPDDKSVLQPKTSYADYFAPWRWTLGSGLNLEALKQEVKAFQLNSWINLFLISVTIGVLVVFFINNVNLQIRQLVSSMKLLAAGSGNLKHRLSLEGGKEVVEIARSYNQLTSSLEEMAYQLHQDRERFFIAVKRMQPDLAIQPMDKKDDLTLDGVRQMVKDICLQAEALELAHLSLKEMAEQDPVTGLLSPQAFEQQFCRQQEGIDPNTPNTLVLIGVDLTGAEAGPDPIVVIAGVISHKLPDSAMACYLPGTGFVYWSSFTDSSEGMRLAMAIQQQIRIELGEVSDISLGVSSMLGGGKNYDLRFSEAERALIRARNEGGNRVYEY